MNDYVISGVNCRLRDLSLKQKNRVNELVGKKLQEGSAGSDDFSLDLSYEENVEFMELILETENGEKINGEDVPESVELKAVCDFFLRRIKSQLEIQDYMVNLMSGKEKQAPSIGN